MSSLNERYERPSLVVDRNWLYANVDISKFPKNLDKVGKWLIFGRNLDELWLKIRNSCEKGELGIGSKVSTAKSSVESDYVICVYTYDSDDREDVMLIRDKLRELGVDWEIGYKEDKKTKLSIYSKYGHKNISKYRSK